jgi:hypothetical protein
MSSIAGSPLKASVPDTAMLRGNKQGLPDKDRSVATRHDSLNRRIVQYASNQGRDGKKPSKL